MWLYIAPKHLKKWMREKKSVKAIQDEKFDSEEINFSYRRFSLMLLSCGGDKNKLSALKNSNFCLFGKK
jgi:hypothetical protein